MSHGAIGKSAYAVVLLLAAAMSFVSATMLPAVRLSGELGLCFPSPNLWEIPYPWGMVCNYAMLTALSVALIFLNRQFNLISSTGLVFPSAFIIAAVANPWISVSVNSSTLVAAVNLICILLLFSGYGRSNATRQLFFVSALCAGGAMWQYATLLFLPVHLLSAAILKLIRPREIAAVVLGIAAPYWIAFGLGVVSPGDIRLPELSNLFTGFAPPAEIFAMILTTAASVLLALLLALNNALKVFASNSTRRAYNTVVNSFGFLTVILAVTDFSNMMAYAVSFYMVVAVQIAQFFATHRMRSESGAAFCFLLLYLTLYFLNIYLS